MQKFSKQENLVRSNITTLRHIIKDIDDLIALRGQMETLLEDENVIEVNVQTNQKISYGNSHRMSYNGGSRDRFLSLYRDFLNAETDLLLQAYDEVASIKLYNP